MKNYSHDLQDLSVSTLRSISERLGGVAVLHTSKELKVGKTQEGSIRTRIITKLQELQTEFGGAILTEKGNLADGPARDAFIGWYLEQRAADVAANPQKDYKAWAIVHLKDALKHRPELVKELSLVPATA